MRLQFFSIRYLPAILVLSSCGSYKQNIMFKVPEGAALQQQAEVVQKNYSVQKNDLLNLSVFTNKGELIIDPDFNLLKEVSTQNMQSKPELQYLVDINGVVKFPMIGEFQAEGLTLRQIESVLQKEFAKFYTDPFVSVTYANKRIIVLGAPGGKVIPLVNENITLAEVLALASGLNNDSKSNSIRVLRGNTFFVADLSTIEGYLRTNMVMQPGDIVYVEPIRRPVSEALRDYGPVVSILTSLTTLVIVILSF